MQKMFFLILLGLQTFHSFSQNDKVELSYKLRNPKVYDSLDFDLFVGYNNLTTDSVYVYNSLSWGHIYEPLSNIFINFERFEKGAYKQSFFRSGAQVYQENEDSIFLKTLEKIGPGKSKSVKINLLATCGWIKSGKYRITIQMKKVINDINKPTGISYYAKKYIYFEVVKDFWGDLLR